jgi:type I restriction enzyme S subunit
MVHVTKATFDSTRVAVPPLAEQRRIVDAIEEFFSRIDAGADVLQSAGNKAATAMRQFRRAALAGWPTCDLSDVAEVVSGNTPKGLENIPGGTIPFYKVGDMNESDGTIMGPSRTWIDETTRQNLGIHLRPEGTVIFPKRGGAIATNKKRQLGSLAAFDLNTMGVIPGEGISAEYLIEWFQTIDLSQLSDGSNVPQINHGDIRPLRIPVPPPQEQVRIVTEIRLVSDAVRYGSALAESALKRLETLRIGVLALALSGRLVPQDPQAKTAGALLDRIHAERADSLGRSPRKMAKK